MQTGTPPDTPLVLVAEDEPAIADTVLYALHSEGFRAEHCLLGGQALERLRRGDVDLLVLDVGLPDLNGFEVCRRLRGFSQVPVIILTARNDEIDRVLGLELGADDYMAKPFSPRELVARVRARLRRSRPAGDAGDALRVRGDFAVDAAGHRIRYRDRALDLTRANADLHQMQADLVQAGKLAALGRMSAALSHEINQPLAAARNYADSAELLIDRGDLTRAKENIG